MTDIQLVGTYWFWDNYQDQRIYDMASWINNAWSSTIEDGSGSYTATVDAEPSSGVVVPPLALPVGSGVELIDRLASADDYLSNNHNNFYTNADSILICDYYGEDSNTYGWAHGDTAGTGSHHTGIVDCEWEDNNNLPTELSEIKSNGVGFHEILHSYGADHPDGVSSYSHYGRPDPISIMYSWDGANCKNNGNFNIMKLIVSDCVKSTVRGWL